MKTEPGIHIEALQVTISTGADMEWLRSWLLSPVLSKLRTIMTTQTELATQLDAVSAQIDKIGTETSTTLQKVKDLEALLAAGGTVSPEVQTALDALKAHVQTVDDLVADAP